jgi:phage-related baseplate assembly protein
MSAIDLSQLPPPNVVEELDFETIFNAMRNQLISMDPSLADVLSLESEPLTKQLQLSAYRELLLRQRVNEAARAVMIAYARAGDLDNLGALMGVERLMVDPGDPNAVPIIPPTYESDEDYRHRIQLSLGSYSTAGPASAYIYHALSADGKVLDASATSPAPGDVLVSILSRDGDGTAPLALIDTVAAAVSAEDVRPLTDQVTVQSAGILNYAVNATLYTYPGPDSEVVMAEARKKVEDYVARMHRIGLDVNLSALNAALHVEGVQRVEIASPLANVVASNTQATYCTGITLTYGGVDE